MDSNIHCFIELEIKMKNVIVKTKQGKTRSFTTKMCNFETSSRYEGLTLKKENEGRSLQELKLKYAR